MSSLCICPNCGRPVDCGDTQCPLCEVDSVEITGLPKDATEEKHG